MFTKIIVPLDGTAQSNAALPLAITIARTTGAALTLLSVVPEGKPKTDVAATLERIASEVTASGVAATSTVLHGDPAHEIVNAVQAQSADLIIMRTHGRAGVGRAVLGSVAERVVARNPVPVMLMRPGGRRLSHVQTLLVPVDGSPGGAVALGTAVALGRASGASLRLVEVVVPTPSYVYGDLGAGWQVDPAWDQEAQASAEAYVQALSTRLRKDGLDATGEVVVAASVPKALVNCAEAKAADLIVMSSQALTGAARAFLGSVTDAVVRTSRCPVLVIRRGPQPEPTTAESDQTTASVVTGGWVVA